MHVRHEIYNFGHSSIVVSVDVCKWIFEMHGWSRASASKQATDHFLAHVRFANLIVVYKRTNVHHNTVCVSGYFKHFRQQRGMNVARAC